MYIVKRLDIQISVMNLITLNWVVIVIGIKKFDLLRVLFTEKNIHNKI